MFGMSERKLLRKKKKNKKTENENKNEKNQESSSKNSSESLSETKGTYGADVYDDEPVRNYVPENHEQTRRQYLIPLTPIILLFVF
ncbi:hypothetical protein TNCV_2829481 [Trichonephila clavipes]|nr:hypothetical protein TNCV_2829481 [Trichonephila clavipes]